MDIEPQYLTYPLNGLLMVVLPLALGAYLTRRFKLGWGLFWIGAATFTLSQVGHLPFNRALTILFQQGILPSPPQSWSLPFNAVVLGLSAGLWEELARYGTYRWWARDARSWRKGLLLGAGHGGIEAIFLGLLVLAAFAQMAAIRGTDLSALVPPEQLAITQEQITAYWSTPWPQTLIGAVERVFTLIAHLAFSVLVLQAFTRRQLRWLWLAVGWHALIDAIAVYFMGIWSEEPWGMFAVEGLIAISALLNLGIILALRSPEPILEVEAAPAVETLPPSALPEPEATPENLENTRYQ